MPADTFELATQTVGQILSNTTPPIRVPDYQRDFSWENTQVSEFWHDLYRFGDRHPGDEIRGRQYFLGAMVLVNDGESHLLLDGQQRLAAATILLAVLRDVIYPFNNNAGGQIHSEYIAHEDHLVGGREPKLRLNVFDRDFFRDTIQTFPRPSEITPQKRSHALIQKAYEFFFQQVSEGWSRAGDGQHGFDWARRITQVLRNHISVVTVTSQEERNAAAIFETLNDRGIGLSTADLLRSWLLGQASDADRDEIIECWSEVYESCGTGDRAQALIRMAWVAHNGDVKTRALYNVVRDELTATGTSAGDYSRQLRKHAQLYKSLRIGDTDDEELNTFCEAIRSLRATAAYPLLLAAGTQIPQIGLKRMAEAILALAVRHNIVCTRDRTLFEAAAFQAAKSITDTGTDTEAIRILREISPDDEAFQIGFRDLRFKQQSHGIARTLLRFIELKLRPTEELDVASPSRVHLEHICPQTPLEPTRWTDHDAMVGQIGNLTLLSARLNEQIKNADFSTKKGHAYARSDLQITKALIEYDEWTPETIRARQKWLCQQAMLLWPQSLIRDPE